MTPQCTIRVKQGNTWVKLHTFNSDLDDVVYSAQVVCGCTAVVPSISFIHIRNLEYSLEVLKGHPAARQLSSIFLPGDLWSGPITEAAKSNTWSFMNTLTVSYKAHCCKIQKKFISCIQIIDISYSRCLLTSHQQCIPAPESPLSEPSYCWWHPEATWNRGDAPPLGFLNTWGHTTKSEPDRNIRLDGSSCHSVTPRGVGWNHELRGPFILSWRKQVVETNTVKWRVRKWFVDRRDSKWVSDDPTQCNTFFFWMPHHIRAVVSELEIKRNLLERSSLRFVAMATRGFLAESNAPAAHASPRTS